MRKKVRTRSSPAVSRPLDPPKRGPCPRHRRATTSAKPPSRLFFSTVILHAHAQTHAHAHPQTSSSHPALFFGGGLNFASVDGSRFPGTRRGFASEKAAGRAYPRTRGQATSFWRTLRGAGTVTVAISVAYASAADDAVAYDPDLDQRRRNPTLQLLSIYSVSCSALDAD